MKQTFLSRAVLVALSGMAVCAFAQDKSVSELAPITIMGNTINGVDTTLPNVDVVNVSTLRNPKVTNLQEALAYNPAVEINSANGNPSQIFIRGMGSNYVQLTIDGDQVPDFYAYGPYTSGGRDFVETDTLRQIDVIKGLSSPKQSTGALAGTVNLQTYNPSDFVDASHPFHIGADVGYTSKNRGFGGTLSLAGTKNALSGLVMLTHRKQHETANMGKQADGTLPDKKDISKTNLLAKGELDLATGNVVATGEYFKLNRKVTPKMDPRMPMPVKPYEEPASRARLALEGNFNDLGAFAHVNSKLAWTNYEQTDESAMGPGIGRVTNKQSGVQAGVDASSQAFTSGSLSQKFLVGVGYKWSHYDQYIMNPWMQINAKGQPVQKMRFFPIMNRNDVYGYVKDKLQVGSFSVTPGLRLAYDKLSPSVDDAYRANIALVANTSGYVPKGSHFKVSPSLNLGFALNNNAQIFASYARGERSADMTNIGAYDHGFGFFLPNPTLKDETSHNFELGYNFVLPKQAEFKIIGFYSKFNNFIANRRDGVFGMTQPMGKIPAMPKYISRPYNIKEYQSYGIELESSYAVSDELTTHVSFGWMKGRQGQGTSHNVALNQAYPLKAVVGLSYNHDNRFGGDIKLTAAGKGQKNDPEVGRDGKQMTYFQTPAYAVADLTAWWKPINNMTVTAGIYNLTNTKYWSTSDANGLPTTNRRGQPVNFDSKTQPGRNFALNLKYSF